MFISHPLKFIFIAIPKTGSSAIHTSFKESCGMLGDDPEPEEHHKSLSNILIENPNCQDYKTITFIRNPWDRLLSTYCDFVQNRKREYSHRLPLLEKPLLSEYGGFEDFCLRFPESKWKDDVHFRHQYSFLEIDGRIKIDFLGRFEHFYNYASNIFQSLHIPYNPDTLKRKVRTTEHSKYQDYFSPETRDIIGNYFKKDIYLFNYDF